MKSRIYFSILCVTATLALGACKKTERSCYDETLREQWKDAFCTADCPGVVGCDGNTYCNECEANRQGIRVD